jgi:hypothetical protein
MNLTTTLPRGQAAKRLLVWYPQERLTFRKKDPLRKIGCVKTAKIPGRICDGV